MTARAPGFMDRLSRGFVEGVATVGGIGRIKPAPGTWGSLAGTLFYGLALMPLAPWLRWVLVALLLVIGWLFCDEGERRMGLRDPGCIVIDEFAAMPLVFIGISPALVPGGVVWALLVGFAFFRLFDIWKPLGIRKLQDLPGGLGVMVDDVAAALAACTLLHLLLWLGRVAPGL